MSPDALGWVGSEIFETFVRVHSYRFIALDDGEETDLRRKRLLSSSKLRF